jgi:sortase A
MERCLWAIGFVALTVWLAVWGNSQWQQAKGSRELDRLIVVQQHSPVPAQAHATLSRGDLIGRIDIPRLGLSTVIFEGTDGGVLRDGAGHLSGSALPGQKGNVVLAAHRDSFFQPLRYIQMRDAIDVVTPEGTRHYKVKSTAIVTPDRAEVMAPTRDSELTLITCYPFDWFGHAPKRFIVVAREVRDPSPATVALPVKAVRPKAIVKRVAIPESPVAETALPQDAVAEPDVVPNEQIAAAPLLGNRVIRGLKKLNPKGLLAKLGGS